MLGQSSGMVKWKWLGTQSAYFNLLLGHGTTFLTAL